MCLEESRIPRLQGYSCSTHKSLSLCRTRAKGTFGGIKVLALAEETDGITR